MAELGSDIAGVFDLDTALSVVTGRTALAQQILRRLTTPRGGLPGTPTYGYDLESLIGANIIASVVEQRVEEQVLDEEEVRDASADVVFDARSSQLTVTINAVDSQGPFELVLSANELTFSAFIDDVLFLSKAP